ncbi:hypothetical protein KAFR_0B01260 [Kazachstania africana CBS 2517]|uniref:26S proteasome regulatory subunit RPN2 n=1 Tax=Kazachstania africana (strain ATCC 22294 / BCRC 22015 / CBS 2517 / CECT 1963 / NBRC 1671 / NRRL Y-8276) TaxID=1071382 RepID=H2APX5_KAZAF|nr:hypothetical protein KAFR_0B01260 [Kazachstania africana CBS 2517]CCF56425.1 hypothetical protein KAFR_0B01260 [Kazachstania africana CBS 2517]
MSLTSATPLLALLKENDDSVKSYALQSINGIVDQEWPEVSNDLPDIEALYDDSSFSNRKMAALVASKVYYNLGEYEPAVKYALAAEECFDIDEKTQFVETIVSKSIELYIELSGKKFEDEQNKSEIDPKLTSIFERMLDKCIKATEFKLAVGIAMEGLRLDIVEAILSSRLKEDTESNTLKLINYVLTAATTTVSNTAFKTKILDLLFKISMAMESIDYYTVCKLIVNLNDSNSAVELFEKLRIDGNQEVSYQIAFDLVSSATQGLLTALAAELRQRKYDQKLVHILSGVPTCDFRNTFLLKKSNIDVGLLNKAKSSLDGKYSLFHTAVSVANGFMHAGTTDNSFIKANLSWLGKAQNWAKFTATASLGVIHKGNLVDGKKVMAPYLPGSRATSRYIKGGSLYALGLIYAGFGTDILDFLIENIDENMNYIGDEDIDILMHGASLGLGLAAMGVDEMGVNESLKAVLYSDLANSGEAAALGFGLSKLGTGDDEDIFAFAQETKHGNIKRGIAMAMSLINYGRQEQADEIIDSMLNNEDPLIRYGGAYTVGLAYVGTGNNKAVKKLLHFAVSDSNDDVRRAAVTSLGFLLLRDYTTVPKIVELLANSHNPHVRCGTAFALGISCAGKALDSALDVLEPLMKDPVDFVRQAAMIASSMIMIQQTEKLNPRVAEINKTFLNVMTNKHQEGLAKFGACVAQGIMNAGGRNVTIQLENPETGTLDAKSIVGLAMFSQFWYWFPLSHFLSLAFTPTVAIAVRGSDLAIPDFELNCYAKEGVFDYRKMYEEEADKEVEKVATAVLSTTARAKARAKKTKKDTKAEETKKLEEKELSAKAEEQKPTENDEYYKNKYSSTPFKLANMSRVLPQQARYVSFIKDGRFVPIRKSKNTSGIIIVHDTKPEEPIETIETVRSSKDIDAPLPSEFIVKDELDFDKIIDA